MLGSGENSTGACGEVITIKCEEDKEIGKSL